VDDRDRLIEAWRAAAIDLDIGVTAPFTLEDRHGAALEFIAHVRDFGRWSGTLVWMMPEPLPAGRLPFNVPYLVSALNPNLYTEYDRARFVETLESWGWAGRVDPPDWYRGP